MEMPGSAPGVWKQRWQYCPMRTRRLCGLTLVVLAAHAVAWQLAVGGLPALGVAPAGVQRVVLVSVPQRAQVPVTTSDAAAEPVRAAPRIRAGDGGALRRAPRDASAWPVYATQAPPPTMLRYALVQTGAAASAAGAAELEWRRDAGTFSLPAKEHMMAALPLWNDAGLPALEIPRRLALRLDRG